jgi:hypothetical protein
MLTVTKLNWYLNFNRQDLSNLQKIDIAFELIADEIKEPNFFYELVRTFISEKVKDKKVEISPVEKYYAFPDCPGIESVASVDIHEFFTDLVTKAFVSGELPEHLGVKPVQVALMSLLIGVPLSIEIEDFPRQKEIFKEQLQVLWKGFGRKAIQK